MPSLGLSPEVLLHVVLSLLNAASPPQANTPVLELTRIHFKENDVLGFITNGVQPGYPREARLAHTEGVVKLMLVIAADGTVADVRGISGDPLLLDSVMKAVRLWRFATIYVAGHAVQAEIPLSFNFSLVDPPKPAYLHLTNGRVIRADDVREFTDGIEYVVGRRTHHIPGNLVADINACARISIKPVKKGDCVASGGPSFTISAIPLLKIPQ